ncbi:DUF3369 domain-containing protein [Pseudoalteromonas aurantia]|uniref:Phosphodiesterase n=1 Tax=Pseudoalteromonas aurantia 208 TaxID=1314867 RepID=A0ABR9E9W0_9GAMM|nr:DUF3369 domain-containing protein [Pseudoalteromonas aurantia]MBE0367781.1 hypothetical protein [Pseudoalteromonas aurantia 208]
MFKKKSKSDSKPKESWKVLIVDDEPDIHTVTKITLGRFEFDDKKIEFLSAYSGSQAKEILAAHSDIALVFLDVVMESDDAGLLVAQYIREELKNTFVRIILRTGQPGQAPEREIIVNYDINDYKEKTNLSSDKLFTVMYTGLRGYRDILSIENARAMLENHRVGLEKVIDSTASLFRIRSLDKFANGLLVQLASLLHVDKNALCGETSNCAVKKVNDNFEIIAATGVLQPTVGVTPDLPENIIALFNRACAEQKSILNAGAFVGYFPTTNTGINLIYLERVGQIDALDRQLLELFSHNISVAFENLALDKEIFDTQSEIIDTLGEVVESRSKEAANHVRRVSHLSKALAEWAGLAEDEANQLFMASPMHDVGKVAIPDSVLLKPGKLDASEWEIMKSHVSIGHDIFARSKRPVLKAAAIVAGQHHEKYNGKGYPNGLAGEDIHIFGRIVALVDVFDALSHSRCYKEAWPLEEVVALLNEEKGEHFDPKLVDLFIENIDKVTHIMDSYPD